MTNEKIIFVCHANYCRSPVAEKIFNNINQNKSIYAESAGIAPFKYAGMDPRSIRYLDSIGIKDVDHFSKKIDKSYINKASKVYVFDYIIFLNICEAYKNQLDKIEILHTGDKSVIEDPYKLESFKHYELCMNKIKIAVEKLLKDVH